MPTFPKLITLSTAVWLALAASSVTASSAEADRFASGLYRVANVVDTDIAVMHWETGASSTVSFPGATFLRLHLVAGQLPAGARVKLVGKRGELQWLPATDIVEAGAKGYYAMSMDGDQLSISVIDDLGVQVAKPFDLRIDRVDVGFDRFDTPVVAPSAVIGADQRLPAVCYEVSEPGAYRRAQAVARVYGHGYLGTAWRVSQENRMLTNHHVIGNEQNAADFELWFGYERKTCDSDATRPGVKVRGGERLIGDASLDFQLFTINDAQFDSVASFGYLGLNVDPLSKGQVIYIPQHGGGRPKQLALFTDGDARCTIDSISGKYGRYTCDTQGGSSGSPVVDANTHRAVVLHNSTTGSANQGPRIGEIWPKIQPYFDQGNLPEGSP